MLIESVVAAIHHVLAFGLVSILFMEILLVEDGMSARTAARMSKIDLAYGISFGLLVVAGLARVFYYEKGPDFYLSSWFFLSKFGLLLVAAGLSVPPTIVFLRWARAAREGRLQPPDPAEVRSLRRFLLAEAACLLPVPLLAAFMAKGY